MTAIFYGEEASLRKQLEQRQAERDEAIESIDLMFEAAMQKAEAERDEALQLFAGSEGVGPSSLRDLAALASDMQLRLHEACAERDEAVALLRRTSWAKHVLCDNYADHSGECDCIDAAIDNFLARIDAKVKP